MTTKKYLEYQNYLGSVEFDLDRGRLYGEIQFIKDLVTYEATTLPELEEAFQDSVDEYLETCEIVGKNPDKAFSGTFNVRVGEEMHRDVSISACKNGMKLNEYVKHCIQTTMDLECRPTTPHKVENHNHTHNHYHGTLTSERQPRMSLPVKMGLTLANHETAERKSH